MIFLRLRALLFKSPKERMNLSITYAVVPAVGVAQDPYPYAFVNDDETARELDAAEREYLEQPFIPSDGGRPYVKSTFEARDSWGSLKGFLHRSKLPDNLVVAPVPANNSHPPMSKADYVAFMKEKALQFGREVIEKLDGSVKIKRETKK